MLYFPESSNYLEFIYLKIEGALLWQVQCHKHKECYFRSSRKILCRFQPREVGSQDSVRTLISQATSIQTTRTFRPDSHQYREVSNNSRLHMSGRHGNTFRCSSEFQKNSMFKYISESVRTKWLFRPDAILNNASRAEDVQPSGRSDLIMEIAYSKSATVRTLGQHRPDAALFRKESQRYFGIAGCNVSCPNAFSYRPDPA